MRVPASLGLVAVLFVCAVPSDASATCFCMLRRPPPTVTQQRGIADDPSYNPASAVVLLRDGRRTVLTIEAAYEGPAVELSMVVPIPSALEREDVRTISGTAFRRLDQRTAPRVRHVWPTCARPRLSARAEAAGAGMGSGGGGRTEAQRVMDEFGVEIEDEWPVDEYDVTLLGAQESTGLLAFLRERGLELGQSATDMLRGYIESGHRFVLLRVDPSRAQRLGETMMLSPIQIEYDSDRFEVPVRLGTLNSPGEQELLLYVLSPDGRYEVANRPSVEAPTDLRMRRDARGSFAELYNSITDEIFRRTPGAAITEYAHVVGRHVRASEIAPFGYADVARGSVRHGVGAPARRWTVTRMRHRYGTELRDDLTLRQASPLTLTRRWRWPQLRTSARAGESAFHVQYVVEHTGCADTESQRRQARRWATAESMWEARHDLWPGQVVLDPITSLGIEPGSSAPAGWPPPPAPPPAPPNGARAQPTAPTTAAGAAPTTGPLITPDDTPFGAGSAAPAAPAPAPAPPPAASTDASPWSCAAASRTSGATPVLALACAAILFATRRRARG